MLDWRYLIDREVNRLQVILDNGLPDHFNGDFDRYMADWSLDFTQDLDIVKEFKYLLNSLLWVVLAMKIEDKYGYNFIDVVNKAIAHFNNERPKPARNEWRKRILGDKTVN